MRVDTTRIPSEGSVSLSETCDSSILDFDKEGVVLTSPLEVQAEVSKDLTAIIVKAKVSGRLSFVCVRCLENFEKDINKELKLSYPIDSPDSMIDLTDQIRQEVVLSEIPLKPVCSENCKGLCPNCGENLNKGQCKC